jgi:hypothetical protein
MDAPETNKVEMECVCQNFTERAQRDDRPVREVTRFKHLSVGANATVAHLVGEQVKVVHIDFGARHIRFEEAPHIADTARFEWARASVSDYTR